MMANHEGDLVAAGLILRRMEGMSDRWLLLRSRKHREWGFPKGHQDPGESLLCTALRECVEECGIGLLEVEGTPLELHYELSGKRRKRVVYYPAVTSCSHVTLSDEHDDYAWLSAKGVREHLPYSNLRSLFESYCQRLDRAPC